mgnify:CR=1 FL=1
MREYELVPRNGRKSFYRKAMVLVAEDGSETLKSYDTLIIKRTPNGTLIPLASVKCISMTTSTHLKSFCGLNKADYRKLYTEYYKED